MIDGHVEEALDLVGVQVHGDQAIETGHAEQVGNQLGADGDAGLVLPVLPRPTEVGDDGNDRVRRGAFGCVHHQQQLHEVVRVGKGGLHKEDILAADTFFVRDGKFTVSEMLDVHLPEGAMQAFADSLCEVTGVGSREDGKRRISTHPFSGL